MDWLVIGGNGQLGKALTIVLSERKITFRATATNELDITSFSLCRDYIRTLAPQVIVNAAAWTDVDRAETNPDEVYAVNAFAVLNLAAIAKITSAVFVHISTDYVFSGFPGRPWQENDLRKPVSVYGTSKALGESSILRDHGEHSYIFRTAWLYSQWGKNFAKTMTRLALSGDGEVKVVNDRVGQPTSALDLANQIVDSVLARLPFGIYHATNSGHGSWFDFAEQVFELSGADSSRIVPISANELVRPAKRPEYSVLGHGGWSAVGALGTSVAPMRHWQISMKEAMPAIITLVQSEIDTWN